MFVLMTPSPPRPAKRGAPSALRFPLSPKGAREEELSFWIRYADCIRSCSQYRSLMDEPAFGEACQIEGAGVDQVGVAGQNQIRQDLAGGG